jgi:Glycosyl transferase family 2
MGDPLPRITIVMPSYNQAPFLEQAIRSVLDQNYPNLEYFLLDGGSTDGSTDIIKKYAHRIDFWRSEKDRGQFAAITEGFQRATGDIFAFLNSDDMYLPWTFSTVARIFTDLPAIQWLTSRTMIKWDELDQPVHTDWGTQHARTWFYRGWSLGKSGRFSGWIQQESTFWRRSLWQAAGSRMDETLFTGGDFELWARFWKHADLVTTNIPLAGFRQHRGSKAAGPGGLDRYVEVCQGILSKYRRETFQSSHAVGLLRLFLKITGRGGKRFGSTINWVDYSLEEDRWFLRTSFVI